ncbi:MAG: nucleic acid-binding protein [Deltaproteobacteria bacterium]|jgi:predicted nucleic acid-binding protein|nr:nucleic acid-binding protein [Deltaproteobacteria bacterium]
MSTLFADAAYFVATLNPQDDLHDRAISIGRTLDDCLLVTTEMVLTEVLNFFAERGRAPRQLAANLIQRLRQDANTRIVAQTSAQFDDALELYRNRQDKQ